MRSNFRTCFLPVGLLVGGLAGSALAHDGGPERVFLIGLDGVTWTVLDTLIQEGRVPHLKSCAERGVRAPLGSMRGYHSASIWTTIVTGKNPEEHGILDFIKDPGNNIAYSPSDRKAATLWDAVGAAGKSVLVVGYFATHPVEPVNGVMVSNQLVTVKEGWIWPESARAIVEPLVYEVNPPREELKRFTPVPTPASPEFAALLTILYNFYSGDWFKVRAAEALLARHRYDFFTIHIWGTDSATHQFARFSRFDRRKTTDSVRQVLGGVLEGYYAYADEIVGRLSKFADDRTAIVIVSDHGASPQNIPGRPDPLAATASGTQFWDHDGEDGILIACGPGIRRGLGGGSARATVMDLAPTLLYLSGLPRADDMPGRILAEMLEPVLLEKRPVRSVPSYPRPRLSAEDKTNVMPSTEVDKLRALGYLQ